MARNKNKIFCCGCQKKVAARLTNGAEIYPHRKDLASLPFWKCDTCRNYVGCHHKTQDRTRPLGVIPTPEIRQGRQSIHAILDPIWKDGKMSRNEVYADMSSLMGKGYHTANLNDTESIEAALWAAKDIAKRASERNAQ